MYGEPPEMSYSEVEENAEIYERAANRLEADLKRVTGERDALVAFVGDSMHTPDDGCKCVFCTSARRLLGELGVR